MPSLPKNLAPGVYVRDDKPLFRTYEAEGISNFAMFGRTFQGLKNPYKPDEIRALSSFEDFIDRYCFGLRVLWDVVQKLPITWNEDGKPMIMSDVRMKIVDALDKEIKVLPETGRPTLKLGGPSIEGNYDESTKEKIRGVVNRWKQTGDGLPNRENLEVVNSAVEDLEAKAVVVQDIANAQVGNASGDAESPTAKELARAEKAFSKAVEKLAKLLKESEAFADARQKLLELSHLFASKKYGELVSSVRNVTIPNNDIIAAIKSKSTELSTLVGSLAPSQLDEVGKAAGRVLAVCMRCHAQEDMSRIDKELLKDGWNDLIKAEPPEHQDADVSSVKPWLILEDCAVNTVTLIKQLKATGDTKALAGSMETFVNDMNGQSISKVLRDLGTSVVNALHALPDTVDPGQTEVAYIALTMRNVEGFFRNGGSSLVVLDHEWNEVKTQAENKAYMQDLSDRWDIGLVAAPGQTSKDVHSALLEYAGRRDLFDPNGESFCFAILDCPQDKDGTMPSQGESSMYHSAAAFWPWLRVDMPKEDKDDEEPKTLYLPPSAFLAGIIASTDSGEGVHQSPAGVRKEIAGVSGLAHYVSDSKLGEKNAKGINVLRRFPGQRAPVVWGCRTLSEDVNYRYISVARLLLMIRKTIKRHLREATFSPNGEVLQARVKRGITTFLRELYRNGALSGLSEEEAFLVVCDRSNNPDDLVRKGILNVRAEVKPAYPAEFIVVSVTQKIDD